MTDQAAHLRDYLARIIGTQACTTKRQRVARTLVNLIAERTGDSMDAIWQRASHDANKYFAPDQTEGGDER